MNDLNFDEDIKNTIDSMKNSTKNIDKSFFINIAIIRDIDNVKDIFKKYILEDGFICGGYARYCCSALEKPVEAGDIDIYCKSEESFQSIKGRIISDGYIEDRSSETALTLKKGDAKILQLIKPVISGAIVLSDSNVENILSNFDITVARVGITFDSLKLRLAIADDKFLIDDVMKRIRIKNIHCPIAQIYRVSKYMHKGYFLSMKECLKIFADWDDRGSSYKNKLLGFIEKSNPSKEEIDDLEKLLHID